MADVEDNTIKSNQESNVKLNLSPQSINNNDNEGNKGKKRSKGKNKW